MGYPNAERIAQRVFDLGLLDERQLQEVWASFGSRNVSAEDFLYHLVRREFLTNYQVERLTKGERSGFFFGPYKVLYLVGTGTFARVYRAVHRDTGQVVALKVLRNRYRSDPIQYGQFVREGRVGCALRHANIVPIYDVVSDGKTHFMVMEFVEGQNLREFVKIRRKLDPLEATRLMTDVAGGMRYAFEHGLTHRDLKMTNVLVASTGQAKLVDFGLAAMDETLADDVLADLPNARTIDYAALERATGVRKDDTRSDIYFMGCILYHMLTGVAPLSDTRDRLQRLSKQRFLDVIAIKKLDPSMPDTVALVVNKAMSLDPSRRYQSPSAMLSDLHIAARRLKGNGNGGDGGSDTKLGMSGRLGESAQPSHTVLVVESNAQMQDIFREGLKKAGYRVLMTADPGRALARLQQDSPAAECIVFSAQEVGPGALQAFNEMIGDKRTETIPAVLLLDPRQRAWEKEAFVAEHRAVLRMPITLGTLRETLGKMLAPAPQR